MRAGGQRVGRACVPHKTPRSVCLAASPRQRGGIVFGGDARAGFRELASSLAHRVYYWYAIVSMRLWWKHKAAAVFLSHSTRIISGLLFYYTSAGWAPAAAGRPNGAQRRGRKAADALSRRRQAKISKVKILCAHPLALRTTKHPMCAAANDRLACNFAADVQVPCFCDSTKS